ncbi:hypothetical protein VP01_1216g6 [Puccinia sorghi]|uniref:Uncharacterized protein n=1 Tax=Puccinia sorghi TaxID=27349 RepID=A0A0L6VQ85_9BASI|nr:hypothetical protein VP01_1216g6 [Puccinia sorghi]
MASAADIQAIISAAMDAQAKHLQQKLNSRDEIISKLMSKVGLDDYSSTVTTSRTPIQSKELPGGKSSQRKKGKASTAPALEHQHQYPPNPTAHLLTGPLLANKHQKIRSKRPLLARKNSRPGLPRQHLLCFSVSGCFIRANKDHLESPKQKSIPGPPHPNNLTEFNLWVSDAAEIAQIVNNFHGATLVSVKEISSLKTLRLGQRKIGQGIVKLDNFFVEYTQATLACLGLHFWGPDLDDSPTSLYDEACRQAALKLFQRNWQYLFRLRTQGYWPSKGLKTQLKFALAQWLPKQYQRIISDVNSHRDDDYNPAKGYQIKTLKFQSENETKIFRRLDSNSTSPHRVRQIPSFQSRQRDLNWISMTPTGSTTFYRSRGLMWLIPAKWLSYPMSQSLLGKQVPSKKLTDKQFNLKFFDQLSAPYDLTHKIKSYDDNKETEDEDDGSYGGEEINLDNTSGSGDEDKFDDVDQEDVDFVEEVMGRDDSDYDGYNEEEEDAWDQRYNSMVFDDDPIW